MAVLRTVIDSCFSCFCCDGFAKSSKILSFPNRIVYFSLPFTKQYLAQIQSPLRKLFLSNHPSLTFALSLASHFYMSYVLKTRFPVLWDLTLYIILSVEAAELRMLAGLNHFSTETTWDHWFQLERKAFYPHWPPCHSESRHHICFKGNFLLLLSNWTPFTWKYTHYLA